MVKDVDWEDHLPLMLLVIKQQNMRPQETQRQEEQYGRAAQAPPKFLSSTPVCDVGAFWYPQGNLVPPTRQVPTTVTR
ncbi:DNA-directed RNA polymerase subunit [Trichinella pseudospiralis]